MRVSLVTDCFFFACCILVIIATANLTPSGYSVYCEPQVPSLFFPQVFNSLSNIALFLSVLFICVHSNCWCLNDSWYIILSPIIIFNVALSSTIYHRLQTDWSGQWDILSVLSYVAFEFAVSILILCTTYTQIGIASGFVFTLFVVFSFLLAFDQIPDNTIIVSVLIVSIAILYILRLVTGPSAPQGWKRKSCIWVLCAIVTGTISLCMWFFSTPHTVECEGVHLLGHGLWHIFIAFTISFIYLTRIQDPILF